MIPYWAAEIAAEYQIPTIHFSVFAGATYSFFGHPQSLVGDGQKRMRPSPESLTSPPEWVDFPSLLAYRSFEAIGVYEGVYGGNASGTKDAESVFKILLSSQAVAIRSCPEHEEGRIRYTAEEPWSEIFDWLDRQKPKSVVFVGFGSECKLSKETVHEMEYGLELSGLPFLWALRKPNWAVDDLHALPLEFSDSTHGRGVGIGGEGFGCIEIERSEDGSFTREGIAKALKLAMVSEEGERLRIRAKEAAMVFGDQKLHDGYFCRFVEYLKKGVRDGAE
ncbi:hypothetical protein SLEP1_g2370 [Rubroshorea leprosula]|uniref:Uncharacterized protein n=1 Tax=Rubroshorea leprosula TaxID=152421 RepID=A0AAV5HLB7_9ROSI|nr:hypothetical protein SLEP1_g2370 [Rubroshorea leprosula]